MKRANRMERSRRAARRAYVVAAALAAALIVAVLGGCGRDRKSTAPPSNPPTPQTQMTGVFLGSAENGLIDVTIDTAPLTSPLDTIVTALGVMSRDTGGVVNLTGTYDTATDSLHLNGQGYDLDGVFLPSAVTVRLQGRYTSPSGGGAFLALIGARSSVVHVFCASFDDTTATTLGTLNLAVGGGALAGFEAVYGDTAIVTLQGTVAGSGTTRALAFTGIEFQGNGSWNTLTGHVAGVWASPLGTGVWSGDPCLPGVPDKN